MKIQDYIVPIVLSTVMVFGLQYFFGGFVQKTEQEQASFAASRESEPIIPLKNTVLYDKTNKTTSTQKTIVQTNWGEIGFSSIGGSVTHIEYDKISNRKINPSMQTISFQEDISLHTPTFLIALEEKTPLNYQLDEEITLIDRAIIQYSVENESAKIVKKFTVPYDNYQINLEITITPKSTEKPLTFTRIIFQSPRIVDAQGVGSVGTVIIDKKGQTQRTKDAATISNQGWITPTIFGTESQYFTHALFQDKHHDIARAYYVCEDNQLNAVLEFTPINATRTIDLSFYMGPKEEDALRAVDQKLASIFEYQGLLAPIYKFLFMLLKLLYAYFGNFGIAIILLTLLIKIVLLPLTIKSESAQKQQRELEKKMNYINQKYKNDEERRNLERAEVIKNQGFSIFGTLILGFVVQVPLFMCLNYMLGSAVELYNASFLWIPDLSSRDPFYILPLFVTGVMIAQSPKNTDSKRQINTILIALVVGAIATRFSAGLGLYFVVNTGLAILQTFFVKRFSYLMK